MESHLITILLNVRTLSLVEVFCHLDYCSKFFEKSSKFFEKSSTTYYLKLLNFGITLSKDITNPFNNRKKLQRLLDFCIFLQYIISKGLVIYSSGIITYV
jgi:hypothetical protein